MSNSLKYLLPALVLTIGVIVFSCHTPEGNNAVAATTQQDTLLYLNHSDSAKYVGINTCKLCHQDIYNTFIKTGMGKSFDVASKTKSAGDYHTSVIHDKIGDFYYKAYWLNDSLQFLEYRLKGKDTIYKRRETVNFIIGSGHHTNSHIQSVNGYLNQMPMTFYTQKKQWDLPPGFENGHNSRFMRKIGLECMSCHNNYPEFVLGSENKFTSVPEGINCERCHGPGSIHVQERQTGSKIDTSKYIDYSIVNPAKLSIDAQFDICQRCHLQGNTILKEGKSFYDFKPGMKLSDFMTVFLPKYKHADDEFIMASHADRLKQSQCFIKSIEKATGASRASAAEKLKPYKDAMTCITCHNPHVSVRETNPNVFNDACNNCHYKETGKTKGKEGTKDNLTFGSELVCSKPGITRASNCVSCHMPKSGSIDIPHVTVHDHFIRKPMTKKDKEGIKEFIGLYAINEKNPNAITKAQAYLNQYEKFENNAFYLDSAAFYLKDQTDAELKTNFKLLVQLYFIKNDFTKISRYADRLTDTYLLNNRLIKKSYSNDDAWASYRIGESFYNTGNMQRAINYYKNAVNLAPYVLDFRNKYGAALAANNLLPNAEKEFTVILKENPKHVSALTNLGYVKLRMGNTNEAETLYFKALGLDPDYEPLLLNIAGLYAYKKDFKQAEVYLMRLLKRNPNNLQAKQALQQIKQFI
ncbi:MAG: tetratricopeptide repeat protein [Bacteroidetes bacterium]|nr:tetratricopeptide repeat protein [Bacteroidota bacterium]